MAELKSRLKDIDYIEVAKKVWKECIDNELIMRASAIAFSAMITSVPFMALLLTVAVYLMPDATAAGFADALVYKLEQMSGKMMPSGVADIFQNQIARLQGQPKVAVLSTGSLITIWLSSSLFISVIDALNKIYGVKESRPYWKLRLTAMFMALVQSAVIVVTVSAIVLWPLVVHLVGWSDVEASIATMVTWIISFFMILLIFAITFQVGPSVKREDKYVLPGSLFGTCGFLLTTYVFRIYVETFPRYDAMYGSLGGVMMTMIWFYICSFVLLLAGEINKVFMVRDKQLKKEEA